MGTRHLYELSNEKAQWPQRKETDADTDDDPVGLPTIGYGHLFKDARCSDVKYHIPLSVSVAVFIPYSRLTSDCQLSLGQLTAVGEVRSTHQ